MPSDVEQMRDAAAAIRASRKAANNSFWLGRTNRQWAVTWLDALAAIVDEYLLLSSQREVLFQEQRQLEERIRTAEAEHADQVGTALAKTPRALVQSVPQWRDPALLSVIQAGATKLEAVDQGRTSKALLFNSKLRELRRCCHDAGLTSYDFFHLLPRELRF